MSSKDRAKVTRQGASREGAWRTLHDVDLAPRGGDSSFRAKELLFVNPRIQNWG